MKDIFVSVKFIFVFLLVLSNFANADKLIKAEYFVKRTHDGIFIDGKLNDKGWREANIIDSNMKARWTEGLTPTTRFQAVWDDSYFYFAFYAEDTEIVLIDDILREQDIGGEDRVEIFFSTAKIDQPVIEGTDIFPRYYGVEIDAKGRVLDFSAEYYRKFNFNWNMENLKVAASHDKVGYWVEGKIPLQTLSGLGLINKKNEMLVGVFRGEFNKKKHEKIRWISWLDPKTTLPDFHVSKAFGHFLFVN